MSLSLEVLWFVLALSDVELPVGIHKVNMCGNSDIFGGRKNTTKTTSKFSTQKQKMHNV